MHICDIEHLVKSFHDGFYVHENHLTQQQSFEVDCCQSEQEDNPLLED